MFPLAVALFWLYMNLSVPVEYHADWHAAMPRTYPFAGELASGKALARAAAMRFIGSLSTLPGNMNLDRRPARKALR